MGPLSENELLITDFTVSPLATCVKPNGRIRLILDLFYSHTKSVELGMGIPCSVNKGFQTDRFKTKMSSTPLWLQSMRHRGIGTLLSKLDWESAYKHVHVNKRDLKLQALQQILL